VFACYPPGLCWENLNIQRRATKSFYARAGENTSLFQGFYAGSIRYHDYPNLWSKSAGFRMRGREVIIAATGGKLDFSPGEQIIRGNSSDGATSVCWSSSSRSSHFHRGIIHTQNFKIPTYCGSFL
jgi:hypothetical protein